MTTARVTTHGTAQTPRFEANYLPRQCGLAVAVKHTPYSPFRWELLAVVGPFVFVCGVGRGDSGNSKFTTGTRPESVAWRS